MIAADRAEAQRLRTLQHHQAAINTRAGLVDSAIGRGGDLPAPGQPRRRDAAAAAATTRQLSYIISLLRMVAFLCVILTTIVTFLVYKVEVTKHADASVRRIGAWTACLLQQYTFGNSGADAHTVCGSTAPEGVSSVFRLVCVVRFLHIHQSLFDFCPSLLPPLGLSFVLYHRNCSYLNFVHGHPALFGVRDKNRKLEMRGAPIAKLELSNRYKSC
jgi:hypothetical protein